MDRKKIIVIILVLSALAIFLGFFKFTGFAVSNPKFLVSLDIPPDQQKMSPGGSLLLETVFGEPGANIDQMKIVDLEYSIKDLNGNTISSKSESGSVAVKESEVTSLLVPTTAKSGVYIASVDVTYNGEVYSATKTFEVVGSTPNPKILLYILGVVVFVVLVFTIVKKIKKMKESPEEKRRVHRKVHKRHRRRKRI